MASSLSSYVIDSFDAAALRQHALPTAQLSAKLSQVRLKPNLALNHDQQKPILAYLIVGMVALHVLAVWAYLNTSPSAPQIQPPHKVEITFIQPETPPPVEVPPPPPPTVQKNTPPPQPISALKTAPAREQATATDLTVQENTHAETTSAPVMAASGPLDNTANMPATATVAPPAPPAPIIEEPVIEATANAGHLNNPNPKYPSIAQRNGWYGTVVVRVRVLASGQPESATVQKSSGKKVLDDAAIETILKSWKFVPAKRGNTPIDGWATQPITFKPE